MIGIFIDIFEFCTPELYASSSYEDRHKPAVLGVVRPTVQYLKRHLILPKHLTEMERRVFCVG